MSLVFILSMSFALGFLVPCLTIAHNFSARQPKYRLGHIFKTTCFSRIRTLIFNLAGVLISHNSVRSFRTKITLKVAPVFCAFFGNSGAQQSHKKPPQIIWTVEIHHRDVSRLRFTVATQLVRILITFYNKIEVKVPLT
jgi:hypothetical protein